MWHGMCAIVWHGTVVTWHGGCAIIWHSTVALYDVRQYSCNVWRGVCAIVWHSTVVLYDVRQYSCNMWHGVYAIVWHSTVVTCYMEYVPLFGTMQLCCMMLGSTVVTWSVCHCLAQYSCKMLHGVCAIVWHSTVVTCDMECVPMFETVQLCCMSGSTALNQFHFHLTFCGQLLNLLPQNAWPRWAPATDYHRDND